MRTDAFAARIACVVAIAGVLMACRSTSTISGVVIDYDTHQPIAGASITIAQSGWGWSNGSLVWDKSYDTHATTDGAGAFAARYTVGSTANLVASADRYSEFRHWYDSGAHVTIALKQRSPDYRPLPTDLVCIGVADDGAPFGWTFAARTMERDAARADVFPSGSLADVTHALTLTTSRGGGLRFVSLRDLGVDDDPLVFASVAPESGYRPTLSLDFSGPGGVIFVRTADGIHYAKIAFTPNGLGSTSGQGIRQALLLPSIYNPAGTRELPLERAPLATRR